MDPGPGARWASPAARSGCVAGACLVGEPDVSCSTSPPTIRPAHHRVARGAAGAFSGSFVASATTAASCSPVDQDVVAGPGPLSERPELRRLRGLEQQILAAEEAELARLEKRLEAEPTGRTWRDPRAGAATWAGCASSRSYAPSAAR